MMRTPLVVLASVLCGLSQAQFGTCVKIKSLSGEETTKCYTKMFPGMHTMQIRSGLDLYKLTYLGYDRERPVRLSGLLILPKNGAPKGLAMAFMGTQTDRRRSPSRWTGEAGFGEPEMFALGFGLNGYAVMVPDTLGMGVDARPHPYVQGFANGATGLDMLPAVKHHAKRLGTAMGSKLFITGYSEGGLNAMSATLLAEKRGISVAASAPMSGPYDLSETTIRHFLERAPVSARAFQVAAISYVGYGAAERYSAIKLDNYFVPSFASYIPKVFKETLTMEKLAGKLFVKAVQVGAVTSNDRIFQPRFREAIAKRDLNDPLIALLDRNDCWNWKPYTKMLLPYLPTDDTVPAANTIKAEGAMKETGRVRAVEIPGEGLNHVTAAPIGTMQAVRFFDGGFAAVSAN